MKRKPICLVLGGGGFLGSHLCDGLLKSGYRIRVFEKEQFDKGNLVHILDDIQIIEGDFTNQDHLQTAIDGVDYIFHLISTTLPKTSNENPIYDVTTNVVSTIRLLELARQNKVKKIIFFSSGGTIYGVPKIVPIPENHPTNPICSYGITKLSIEKYLNLYYHLYGLDYTVFRISNPYGERQKFSSSQGAVTVFLYKALNREPIQIWGDGSVIRDYIYVTDVVDAVTASINYGGQYKVFNIGSGNGLSLIMLTDMIAKTVGCPLEIHFQSARTLDVPENILDIKLAKNELIWFPRINLETGLKLTTEYIVKNNLISNSVNF